MKKFSMQLSSDAIRLSKTPFFSVHLAIPVLGILIFTVYQSMTIYPPEKFTVNYYQVLTLIYPLLAAWICSILTEQDVEAGGGFLLLSAPSRMKNLLDSWRSCSMSDSYPGLQCCGGNQDTGFFSSSFSHALHGFAYLGLCCFRIPVSHLAGISVWSECELCIGCCGNSFFCAYAYRAW